mmetsp:Transcript_2539/g.6093  ORF Transcript_2539/g.6093 Transcript_2539/m.6093 type:complete len:235 (-) Transcript_2539:1131-1835(-)
MGTTPLLVRSLLHRTTLSTKSLFSKSSHRHDVTMWCITLSLVSSSDSSIPSPPASSSDSSLSRFPATEAHKTSTADSTIGSVLLCTVTSSPSGSRLDVSTPTPCSCPTTCWFSGHPQQRRDRTQMASCRMCRGWSPFSRISDSIMATHRPPRSSWNPGREAVLRSSLRHPLRRVSSDCSVINSSTIWLPSISRKSSGHCGTSVKRHARHCTCSSLSCCLVNLRRAGCSDMRSSM